MSIYAVDFAKALTRLLPPDKRFPIITSYLKSLAAPLQWLRDLWLGEYRTGSTAQEWLNTSTYSKYERVIYTIYVYESLVDNNTSVPTDRSAWQIVQETFIGLSERLAYNTDVLVLTYALNKRFKTTFRQPPNQSDIYIDVHQKQLDVFLIGATESESSKVYSNKSSEYIIDSYDFNTFYNATIWVPVAAYNSLDTISANCEKIIRAFVDKYIAAGILYQIQTY